jgi:hypothetical protein
LPYHTELQGYLKAKFPEALFEFQIGASRPDIVIGDIAIEVKGPTRSQDLDTLARKCMKYGQHYQHLTMVLFEPQFSQNEFTETETGLKKYFPQVELITKGDFSPTYQSSWDNRQWTR